MGISTAVSVGNDGFDATTPVTKGPKVVTKVGRPLLGKTPMSGAERMRRYRNRHKNKSIT
jgi:hypothetical protein